MHLLLLKGSCEDDWLDEEIVGFEPVEVSFAPFKICISVKPVRLDETYVKT